MNQKEGIFPTIPWNNIFPSEGNSFIKREKGREKSVYLSLIIAEIIKQWLVLQWYAAFKGFALPPFYMSHPDSLLCFLTTSNSAQSHHHYVSHVIDLPRLFVYADDINIISLPLSVHISKSLKFFTCSCPPVQILFIIPPNPPNSRPALWKYCILSCKGAGDVSWGQFYRPLPQPLFTAHFPVHFGPWSTWSV